jgi:hypothetical protein
MLKEVCGVSVWNIKEQVEPREYPCYAYAVVQSFGYEEEQPKYLYPNDIEKMRKSLENATASKGTP